MNPELGPVTRSQTQSLPPTRYPHLQTTRPAQPSQDPPPPTSSVTTLPGHFSVSDTPELVTPTPQRSGISSLLQQNPQDPEQHYIDPEFTENDSSHDENSGDFSNSAPQFDVSYLEEPELDPEQESENHFETAAQNTPDLPSATPQNTPGTGSSLQTTVPVVPRLTLTAPTTSPKIDDIDRIRRITQFGDGAFARQQQPGRPMATYTLPPNTTQTQREPPPHLGPSSAPSQFNRQAYDYSSISQNPGSNLRNDRRAAYHDRQDELRPSVMNPIRDALFGTTSSSGTRMLSYNHNPYASMSHAHTQAPPLSQAPQYPQQQPVSAPIHPNSATGSFSLPMYPSTVPRRQDVGGYAWPHVPQGFPTLFGTTPNANYMSTPSRPLPNPPIQPSQHHTTAYQELTPNSGAPTMENNTFNPPSSQGNSFRYADTQEEPSYHRTPHFDQGSFSVPPQLSGRSDSFPHRTPHYDPGHSPIPPRFPGHNDPPPVMCHALFPFSDADSLLLMLIM
ncbi:hypothetical protein SCHPADRAFT_896106 [Schizopora paradoxa]|uniref:Uncharacterized protein n=1 Tax=Schizopora paradoxa TaxID=27342 RepID=A0A0H2R1J4_9AGAM|nr:hypothetical protein SCHPADRAFT_896106 [Schizopora paradoxa]